jgi:hypothetical protein
MQDFNNHRDWKRGWSYENDAPDDEQWQLDRDWLFSLSGNGWWWGWNEITCPIEELKDHLNNLSEKRKRVYNHDRRVS